MIKMPYMAPFAHPRLREIVKSQMIKMPYMAPFRIPDLRTFSEVVRQTLKGVRTILLSHKIQFL
jgi:hypothetical protein